MDFGFSEEQELLRDQVRRFMRDECSMQTVRALSDQGVFSRELWQQAAELGWLGLIVPETFGGVGLKWVDVTVVLEETGRGLSPLPFASHYIACTALTRFGTQAQRQAWLPKLADGSVVMGFGLYDEPNWVHADAITLTGVANGDTVTLSGSKPFVADGQHATHLLVAYRGGLAVVDAEAVEIKAQPTMDRTKPTALVTFDEVVVPADRVLALNDDDIAMLADCGAVAVTAEVVGAAQAALDITCGYAKERVQFGHPIGKYQGVKHRLADMYVDIESFKSLLYYAAWTVDDAHDELPRAISLAKAYASDAFAQIGIDGVGLHGAIGFTAEYDVQLYMKRSKWARPMYGDSDFHYERIARLGGL